MTDKFTGSFTQQDPIPQAGIDAALAVMQHGRLHRYNTSGDEIAEAALIEQEFAAQTGAKYCLAVASGGYAMTTALRACGVGHGDTVLTNAFTLAPVPGAIAAVGGKPIFVGVTEDLVIDLGDLAGKLHQARVLLLSHMRGHICDMTALMDMCNAAGVTVIEDCAHTMGAAWDGVPSGRWGKFGCYSTQTYKHVNSGEGGLLISDDADGMARAIMFSGSYMLFEKHRAAPPPETFAQIKYETPNISGRMDNLRAAILRPQLRDLATQAKRWNDRYAVLADGLTDVTGLKLPYRPAQESFVASSFQFLLLDWDQAKVQDVLQRCAARGVELKWFGGAEPTGFTSRYDSWRYAQSAPMPASDRILAGIIDMRLPLTFSLADCAQIAGIIRAEVSAVFQAA
ncbi:MAG: DegT/DnrJ/EryC1/StrS family aminotransferase [Yoonia sp.]|jgi:dTDP-4-amino-4,6-dideoxygalactose transaminase|tara:strand:- start:2856 stop:4049 length:1194 start_codon:yes stop_codon:yes gene_type:complete